MPCIFIVTHGPRSIEFKLKISVSDFRRENPKLLVNCRSELRKQISGLCFGASKDSHNTVAAKNVGKPEKIFITHNTE
ncbi:hypothetical protein QQG55_48730 [Brugia pahangi]